MRLNWQVRSRIIQILAVLVTAVASHGFDLTAFKTQPLWPNGVPGSGGVIKPTDPNIIICLAPGETSCGAAVVFCSGGSYGFLCTQYEAYPGTDYFHSQGVSVIILNYRTRGAGYGWPAPYEDAVRAMQLTRSHAKEWGIEPNKIGIIGISAGGHLASTVATHIIGGRKDAADPVERVSSRPDFLILVSAVISMSQPWADGYTRKMLLGERPDPNLMEYLSNEMQVSSQTPPAFMVAANDDRGVVPDNSVLFYLAMRRAKVPAELHIYQSGGHGFGFLKNYGPVSNWPQQCTEWMKKRNILTSEVHSKAAL